MIANKWNQEKETWKCPVQFGGQLESILQWKTKVAQIRTVLIQFVVRVCVQIMAITLWRHRCSRLFKRHRQDLLVVSVHTRQETELQ